MTSERIFLENNRILSSETKPYLELSFTVWNKDNIIKVHQIDYLIESFIISKANTFLSRLIEGHGDWETARIFFLLGKFLSQGWSGVYEVTRWGCRRWVLHKTSEVT